MYRKPYEVIVMAAALLTGCGASTPATPTKPANPAPAATAEAAPAEMPATRNFAAQKIGPYEVQPMFEEEIEDGHFSIRVKGAEFKAMRIWVGPEDAKGVMVVKTELEFDYQHGHVEVPKPVPADAVLWIEIENAAGETFKGSTPLKLAS